MATPWERVMSQAVPVLWYLILGLIVFGIGVFGVLIRRNTLVILICIELMINAVTLIFVAFSRHYGDLNSQIMVFFIMLVAAAEVAIGLVIVSMLYRQTKSVDTHHWSELKE